MGLKGEDGESRTRKHGDGKSGHRDMKQRHGDMKQRHGDSKQKHGDMQQRQGDGVKKRQGENKPISYGEKVKRRRLEAVASIAEEGMSISQKRKLVVREEKLRKNPAKAFERGCNKLYGDLLKCSKSSDKTAIEESVSKMLIFLYEDGNSPLLTLDTKDAQSVTTIYAKPCISRALQLCLKKGSEKNREMIEEKTRNVFDTLAQTSAGHHLCMKLFLYSRSKKEFEVLMQKLYDNPKSFFTKFGFRVWDCAMRRVATAKCRNTILMKLFFEKVLRAELGGDKLNELSSPVEAYKQLTKGYRDIAKERLFVAVDKIVKKEMLESEIVQQLLKTMTAIFDFEASEPEAESKTDAERSSDFSRLSGAIFEGAHVLLATKEGVSVLCRLCGYWTAKERKQFVANMKQQMTLGQQTWRDYLLNDLDALFVTRFILTIDDTRLTKESVLGEIFATKVKALQFKLQDPYAPYDILQNLRATAMLIAMSRGASEAKRWMTQQDLECLEASAPSSKKQAELRHRELNLFFRQLFRLLDRQHPSLAEVSDKHKLALDCLFSSLPFLEDDEEDTAEAAVAETAKTETETAADSDEAADSEAAADAEEAESEAEAEAEDNEAESQDEESEAKSEDEE